MADVTQVGGGDVAVIAGDAETLAHLRVAKLTRIDIGPISAHHTIVLKALQPLGHDGDEIAPFA